MQNAKSNLESLIKKGYDLHRKGYLNKAMKIYKEALKINPNDERLHYYLGYIYDQQGEYSNSAREYKRAIEIKPKNYLSFNNLGLALQKNDKLDEAIETFKKAIEINPEDHMAHFNLGRLYAQDKGWFKKALVELKKAVKLNSTHISGYYGLGFSYEKLGNRKEAIKMYRSILELQPNSKSAKKALIRLKARKNR